MFIFCIDRGGKVKTKTRTRTRRKVNDAGVRKSHRRKVTILPRRRTTAATRVAMMRNARSGSLRRKRLVKNLISTHETKSLLKLFATYNK